MRANYCIQCGQPFSIFKRVIRYVPGSAESDLCSPKCHSKATEVKKVAEEAAKQEELEADHRLRAERLEESREKRRREKEQRETKARKEREVREGLERARRERKEREEREQKEMEERKKPFLDAIATDPQYAGNYIRLGDLLFKEIGLESAATSDPHLIRGRYPFAYPLNKNIVLNKGIGEKLKTHPKLVLDAKESYLKAISLGNMPDFYSSARVKLNYSILLALTEVPQSQHYAREAEKDLRKHLRTHPDDINALKNMAAAIGLYEDSDKVRTRRLQTVQARINEARTRLELNSGPPPKLRPPGSPESPYPENWHELSKNIKKRDGYQCTECEAADVELHAHHILPLSQGGSNEPDNLVTLCDLCHKERHSR